MELELEYKMESVFYNYIYNCYVKKVEAKKPVLAIGVVVLGFGYFLSSGKS